MQTCIKIPGTLTPGISFFNDPKRALHPLLWKFAHGFYTSF